MTKIKLRLCACCWLMALSMFFALSAVAQEPHHNEKLDSVINMLESMPNDSTRLRQAYISIQGNIDQYWALDLIEYAQEQADLQNHVLWALAFRGSKVRWAHQFHDWTRMEEFLEAQREKAVELKTYGNYLSQIGQSAIVMAQMGRLEQSWRLLQKMRKDIDEFDKERYDIFNYLVEADYYRHSDNEPKRIEILISALENNVQTTPLQRISLHVELIDAFGKMGQYDKALAHADSVLLIYDGYSPERKALPQSRGNISEANLRKVEIYQKMGNLPMMKESLLTAEEYINPTDKLNRADISYWWGKYYNDAKDYKSSLQYFDEAADIYRQRAIEEKAIEIELEKVRPLVAMGRDQEALALYTDRLCALDSVHNLMIDEQQTFLGELNHMLELEKRSLKMQAWKWYLIAISSILLALGVIGGIIYMIHVRRELKRNYAITEKKLQEAKNSDREKERFLRNITKLINTPLQKVVKGASLLGKETEMSQRQKKALVETNKRHVGHLLSLVNNVLDLSRLEAGMMKYAKENTDIVRLLSSFVYEYNLDNPDTPINITSEVGTYMMEIDGNHLCACIQRLFSVPLHYDSEMPTNRRILLDTSMNGNLIIIVLGSLFADESKLDETERMVHKVNSYVMRDFHSDYELVSNNKIVFTLKPN